LPGDPRPPCSPRASSSRGKAKRRLVIRELVRGGRKGVRRPGECGLPRRAPWRHRPHRRR
jgi:hypothetical protein